MPQEVYRCGDDGERQLVLLVAVPAPQSNCVAERTTSTREPLVEMSSTQVAQDLTTRPSRCSSFELQTNEGLLRDRTFIDDDRADNKLGVPTTRNPGFGTSKSPKSYWLRRHSDSVFAGVDRVQHNDEPVSSVEHAPRHGKERTVSDSHSTVNEFDVCRSALADSSKPLAQRFQSIVVGIRQYGESDDVFDETPAVPLTYPRKDVDLPHTQELNNAQLEHPSVHHHRSRLAVASTGDLEDICEESRSSGLSEHAADDVDDYIMADSSAFAKLEVNEVGEQQPQSDTIRSLEFSGNSSGRFSEEATSYEYDDRKLMNGETGLARPTAACTRTTMRRRTSRVERPPRTSEATDASSGSGKVHRCTVCRRTFSRSDMLERHARLHTGVRPYACRLCTQVFSRSDHLTTHLRTHTGEKPYACPRCAYTASRRDMVTRHLRVHQSTPAVDVALPVSGVVGPPRRRIYRSRYRERTTRRPDVNDSVTAVSRTCPQSASLDVRSGADVRRVNGGGGDTAICWPREPSSPPASRRRLEHLQALHALSRSVVARGSTGSTDSYSSPGCLSATDVFEFAVSGSGGLEGSPDVFRSPSAAARQSTIFLFPYAAASAALSVCDRADSF